MGREGKGRKGRGIEGRGGKRGEGRAPPIFYYTPSSSFLEICLPTATGSKARWAPQARLRRVWAGAGLQRAAYRGGGGGISWRSPAYSLFFLFSVSCHLTNKDEY